MPKRAFRSRSGISPIKDFVSTTLVSLGKKHRQNSLRKATNVNGSAVHSFFGGKDMIFLGRLMIHWKEIVGENLFQNCYPMRLFKGNLQVICSDSQWLHTFQFIRSMIQERLKEKFPQLSVSRIFALVGKLPENVYQVPVQKYWPAWREEKDLGLAGKKVSEETMEIIQRCGKKLEARKKALVTEGLVLCPMCAAKMIDPGRKCCSVCFFQEEEKIKCRIRVALLEAPWLEKEEIAEMIPGANEELLRETKEALKIEIFQKIDMTVTELQSEEAPVAPSDFFRDLDCFLILKTGLPPHEVSLVEAFLRNLLPSHWLKALEALEEEEEC